MTVVGWDIGGANVKAARLDAPGASPVVVERPFALWREPARLADVLAEVTATLGPVRAAALTMTAELADCFSSKREGVLHVLDAAARALGEAPIHVFGTDGRFRTLAEARLEPERAAAANWLASATWLARDHSDAFLLDVGSTTADLIPIVGGRVAAAGRSDTERLRRGELVYTGVLRTPVSAIVRCVPLAGGWCRVAAEHFAIAADAHLWLGRIPPEAYTCDTADGRGITRADTAARLARVVCADPRELGQQDLTRIARHIVRAQRRRILAAMRQLLVGLGAAAPGVAVVAGAGERLAAEAARAASLNVVRLATLRGRGSALATPATAVAVLLAHLLARQGSAACEPAGRASHAAEEPAYAADDPPMDVVKVGGSLERAGLLAPVLDRLARLAREGGHLLVVPGGGRFADAVRDACAAHESGADAPHWAAILAVDQLAHLVVSWTPRAVLVANAADARAAIAARRLPVLAPYAWLRQRDPLPHSWDVTGDSIAAWVAGQVGARRLVLVKHAAGCRPLAGAATSSPEELARHGVVDAFFPTALPPGVECVVVDARELDELDSRWARERGAGAGQVAGSVSN